MYVVRCRLASNEERKIFPLYSRFSGGGVGGGMVLVSADESGVALTSLRSEAWVAVRQEELVDGWRAESERNPSRRCVFVMEERRPPRHRWLAALVSSPTLRETVRRTHSPPLPHPALLLTSSPCAPADCASPRRPLAGQRTSSSLAAAAPRPLLPLAPRSALLTRAHTRPVQTINMSNTLEQLKKYTTVVSDSGDFECTSAPSRFFHPDRRRRGTGCLSPLSGRAMVVGRPHLQNNALTHSPLPSARPLPPSSPIDDDAVTPLFRKFTLPPHLPTFSASLIHLQPSRSTSPRTRPPTRRSSSRPSRTRSTPASSMSPPSTPKTRAGTLQHLMARRRVLGY